MCVCEIKKNDFTGPLTMNAPILIFEEAKPAGVDWFRVKGSQNWLINYVVEKCFSLHHVWGEWNVGMFVSIYFQWDWGVFNNKTK